MTASKTTSNINEVVFGKEKGVELLGMDLTGDPYLVESDGEVDGDLFGDAIAARKRPDGESAESCELADEPAAADETLAEAELAEGRLLPSPVQPTQSHVEDHRAFGHIPYRTWCSECVRARGTGEKHSKRRDGRRMCVFSFDYLHLNATGSPVSREAKTAGAQVSLTLLVAKDSLGKAVFAHVVPQKGVDPDHYAVDALVRDIMWLGYIQLALRSDNEPAILALLRHALSEARVKVSLLEQIVQEHPNTYDPAGNGEIESSRSRESCGPTS